MKVLYVEDTPGHAELVRQQLDGAALGDFDLVVAASPAAAIAVLLGIGRPDVDCVLLDLGAAGDEGLAVLEQVRTAAFEAPVVVLTGRSDDALAAAAVRGGAQDVVVKGRITGQTLGRALRHAVIRKQRENGLARRALEDPLTGLPNRTLFHDRLDQALSRLGRTQTFLAVLFFDLDGFKVVNDTHGHAAGDELLRETARRLVGALRGGDTAARLGGDEFVVLCVDLVGVDEARRVAGRLLEELPAAASMGVAVADDNATSADAIVRAADAAMYEVKRRGGAGFAVLGDAEVSRPVQTRRLST